MKLDNLELDHNTLYLLYDQFIEIFTNSLEFDIIPNVIKETQLPNLPSSSEILGYDLKKHRIPKIGRSNFEDRHPYKRSLFIQEIARLQEMLNGHKVNETNINMQSFVDYATLYERNVRKPKQRFIDLFLQTINLSQDTLNKKEKYIYDKDLFASRVNLKFDQDIEKEIINNRIFMKFINQIEISLNNLRKNYNYNCKIDYEVDFDDSELKKIILTIDIDGLDVEEKLDFWDEIESKIRKELDKLKKNLDKESTLKFNELEQILYTEVILG